MKLDQFNKRKKKLDQLIHEHAKLEGSLESDFRDLEQVWGCPSLKKGEGYLSAIEKEKKKIEKNLATKTEAFENEWGEILDGDEEEENR